MGTIAISYKMEARENQLPISRFVSRDGPGIDLKLFMS